MSGVGGRTQPYGRAGDRRVVGVHGSSRAGHIRSDNGPEFIAAAIRRWLAHPHIGPLYIEPDSSWENGYAESFHSWLCDELPN